MTRFFSLCLTSILVLGLASAEANAQGLAYVAGTGATAGRVQGAGYAPPDGSIPANSFNYWQEIAGEGGFQQALGDDVRAGDNYANLMTLSSGMWLIGQTSSSGMTMGQTGGAGTIGGGSTFVPPFWLTAAEAGTRADTEVTFRVTHLPAPAGEALVYYGTFSISSDGSGMDTHAGVTGPGGIDATVDGMGVMATWTDITQVPATAHSLRPVWYGADGCFRGGGIATPGIRINKYCAYFDPSGTASYGQRLSFNCNNWWRCWVVSSE